MGANDVTKWLRSLTAAPEPTEQPKVIGPARRVPAAPDPNRWEPPNTTAADSVEVRAMAARVDLFTRRGLDQTQAEQLATRCAVRDLDLLAPSPTKPGGTGMAACMECDHIGRAGHERYRCGNWRKLGITHDAALLPGRFVVEFHRCDGFHPASATQPVRMGRDATICRGVGSDYDR